MARAVSLGVDGSTVDPTRLAEVCERYGVAELSLFGSVARGTATSTSDVHLLYVMAPGRSLGFAINRLEDDLSELFGRGAEVVSKRSLHHMLREGVLAEAHDSIVTRTDASSAWSRGGPYALDGACPAEALRRPCGGW